MKSKPRRGNQKKRVTIMDDKSDKWLRNKVQMYNDAGKRVSVDMLVPIAKKERIPLGEQRYPPGKDKQQEIVRRWIDKGFAKRDQKNGIVLFDVTQIKRLPDLAKVELIHAQQILQELDEVNNKKKAFGKRDFYKFVMLKKKFVYIPTKFLIYSRQTQTTKNEIHTALVMHIENKLKQMELMKNKQRSLEDKKLHYDFERIENIVEEIIESPESFEQPVLDTKEFAELKSKHGDIDLIFELINR